MIEQILNWIIRNKEWLFSGIGGAVILAMFKFWRDRTSRTTLLAEREQRAPRAALPDAQAAMESKKSPVATKTTAVVEVSERILHAGEYLECKVHYLNTLRIEFVELARSDDPGAPDLGELAAKLKLSGLFQLAVTEDVKRLSRGALLMPVGSKAIAATVDSTFFWAIEVSVRHVNPNRETVELRIANVRNSSSTPAA